jgi:hypothetical protein
MCKFESILRLFLKSIIIRWVKKQDVHFATKKQD